MCLVLGKATRLASVLSGHDKTYDAVVRLGVGDRPPTTPMETPSRRARGPLPDDAAIDAALDAFRGTFDQRPPTHSAKKVGGHKAYDLARRDEPVDLKPVPVTVKSLERMGREGDLVTLRVTATAGFYVRALARDLGRALGCGAHLHALRRTSVGRFGVADALPLADAERMGPGLAGHVLTPADALHGASGRHGHRRGAPAGGPWQPTESRALGGPVGPGGWRGSGRPCSGAGA